MVKGANTVSSPNKVNALTKPTTLESHSSGFLSKAQQDILDAAVKEKQSSGDTACARRHSLDHSSLSKSQSLELKAKDRLSDRHSRSRSDKSLGKPKKSGAGGKFNWGASLEMETISTAQDPNDPNYDSAEETSHPVRLQTTHTVQAGIYKNAVSSIAKELFLSGDVQEATLSLQELGQPEFGLHFVKKLITIALDGNNRARELASALLSAIYATVLPPEQIEKGFLALVEGVDDLTLDVPQAPELIAHFLARAVTDDILPPAFLASLSSVPGHGEASVRQKTELLLNAPHAAERILRCWGTETSVTFTKVRDSIDKLLKEYVVSSDKQEATECLQGIGLPLVHHELVKQALCIALTSSQQQESILSLLRHLSESGNVSEDQIVKGFRRVADNMSDLALDVPNAEPDFKTICATAQQQKWLPALDFEKERSQSTSSATHSLQAFKAASAASIKEYYASGDSAELARCLTELNEPGFHSLVIKQAVQLALDAKDRERELTAKMVRELCPALLTRDQVALGFTRLLSCVEEVTLDSPDAPHQLALMLGRFIVDEVLPPAFLTAVLPSLKDRSLGVSVVETTGKLLSARHAAERLQSCWHSGNFAIDDLKSSIKDLVREYLLTADAEEAARCWHDLSVSYFGHQLIFTILLTAFETPAKADLLLQLIKRFAISGEVSQTQIQKGFERVELQLSDLKLDYPSSPKQFESCKEAALEHGWIVNKAQF